ncbi:MAG TPA: cytochrome C oxidase subunit IV family protein [Vicinamibacterales bacterium]|nr:cytochrome C oxidase subunit IV family protein [Vicinamibacterales bacterium]
MSSVAHHVAPVRLYLAIFGALLVGTVITVVVAFFDLGALNNVVMLAIACAKALLVVLFFMHVRWSSRLTWVVAASGFFWLLILFVLTMSDYMSRGWVAGTLR